MLLCVAVLPVAIGFQKGSLPDIKGEGGGELESFNSLLQGAIHVEHDTNSLSLPPSFLPSFLPCLYLFIHLFIDFGSTHTMKKP